MKKLFTLIAAAVVGINADSTAQTYFKENFEGVARHLLRAYSLSSHFYSLTNPLKNQRLLTRVLYLGKTNLQPLETVVRMMTTMHLLTWMINYIFLQNRNK